MSEVKSEYVINIVAPSPAAQARQAPREYKCACGNVLGYLRDAGNWIVLVTTAGYVIKGEAWIPCECGKHRHFKRWARAVPAFLDPNRDKEREATIVLLAEARQLATN